MKTLFSQLFDYDFYCNKQLTAQYLSLNEIPEKSVQLFNHILSAHHIWNQRILKKSSQNEVWQAHAIKDWQDIHYQHQRYSFEIVTNTEDFEKHIDCQNSKGGPFANKLKDILFHIINHSTLHRAQILMEFRENGIEPKPLDYIF